MNRMGRVREQILAAWDRNDGDHILDELARRDPKAFVKLIISCLPRSEHESAAAVNSGVSLRMVISVLEGRARGRAELIDVQQAVDRVLPDAPIEDGG